MCKRKGRIMSDANVIITTVVVSAVVILFYWALKSGVTKAATKLGWKPRVKQEKVEAKPKAEKSAEAKQQEQHLASGILYMLVVGGLIWYFLGGGLEKQAAKDMANIQNQVAADVVQQYGITQRNGTAMDRCVQAGMVAAAFLQAQDEANYQQWKAIEKKDCRAAGVSR